MTVLTATIRLARELRRDHDQVQEEAGRTSWLTAQIMPLSAWLAETWKNGLFSDHPATDDLGAGRLLRPAEERLIWEDVIRSMTGDSLLDFPSTAEAAARSWERLCSWAIPLDADAWHESEDARMFLGWTRAFQARCQRNGWISSAELPASVAELIDRGAAPFPEEVEFAGFLELSPVQQRLIDALEKRGVKVRERALTEEAGDAVRVGFADAGREIRAAAEWARRCLESDPDARDPAFRIGIVVPGLSQQRDEIERVFGEVLHPRNRLRPDLDPVRCFNISLGRPLDEYPVIQTAFLFLGIDAGVLSVESAGRVLRSPFLPGAAEELNSRASLDAELRAFGAPDVSLSDVIVLARKQRDDGGDAGGCPGLVTILETWSEKYGTLQASRLPSDWAPGLSTFLRDIGWPGDRTLDSIEYQTLEAWRELLSDLANLDDVFGRISLRGAADVLRNLASARQFQPESAPAPVQILGVFESSGLHFDRLWLMGLHDGAWPADPVPDPFIPVRLQRRYGLPESSPNRELAFTRMLTGRLLSSAPSVVVSYPEREDDADLAVSPLVRVLPETSAAGLGIPPPPGDEERLRGDGEGIPGASVLEVLDDHYGPACDDVALRGGTFLFKLQAACPFKAFAELRLGARPLEAPEPGLNALDRGRLLHSVLERVWGRLKSHGHLLASTEEGLTNLVRGHVEPEVRRILGGRFQRNPRLAEIEQARLVRIIGAWMGLERQRQPFTVVDQEERRSVEVGGIEVSIRADRVDRLENGKLVILDYKSGECGPADWAGARPDEPQLPIYAVSAEAEVAGVLFARLRTGDLGFRGLAESPDIAPGVRVPQQQPPIARIIDDWREVLDVLGRGFREGRAHVDPKDPAKTCRYCELPSLCRISQGMEEVEEAEDDRG
ncbi:MAG: PD-(D/E)XK nuclease family protein [candidate division Zixibacteria bacterium]|nr:PD-(D/E)XK nuclease family protein [candidate division Zixibacteria bacterium]